MPFSRMRVPWISMVSPSITEATPCRSGPTVSLEQAGRAGEDKGQGGKGGFIGGLAGFILPSHWAEWRKAHCGNCLLKF